jgi:hypothetical protein
VSRKLRSASRVSKNAYRGLSSTKKERTDRYLHNQAEKDYRNRMNDLFKWLLELIPEHILTHEGFEHKQLQGDRCITKAEILLLAGKCILSHGKATQNP